MGRTSISVVIPTFNEEENLRRCIKSLAEQTNDNFEVLVADGGSMDNTVEIAEKNGLKVLDVEKTRPHDVSTAKNMGAKYSKGEILFFLDADMVIDANCFEVLQNEYMESEIVGVALKVLPYYGNKVEKAMYECNNYLARIANKIGFHELSYFSCHSYRKDVFMSVGGFRKDLYACEDLDLSLRVRHFGRYLVTPKSTIWTSTRRLRRDSYTSYLIKYIKYLTEYYFWDRVTDYYDDLC
jgi:glycosyltransferase involved in cell wall biosynthesis